MAEEIVSDLTATLHFSCDGVLVIRSRVARHIAEVLEGISDAMVRAWAGLDATVRDNARGEIADRISRRILESYTVTIVTRPTIVPSAHVWCGLMASDDET